MKRELCWWGCRAYQRAVEQCMHAHRLSHSTPGEEPEQSYQVRMRPLPEQLLIKQCRPHWCLSVLSDDKGQGGLGK
jgi:hypothetical protein